MKRLCLLAALAVSFSLSACKKNIQTNEAVRDAVIKHLSSRTDLAISGMDIDVSNVTFTENEAVAMVSFKPKGGDSSAGMSMRYTLERKGDTWAVKAKADSGMGGHGAAAPPSEMPPNHPPVGAPAK